MSLRDIDSEMLGTYAQLVAQAMIPIIIGSFKSLKTPQSTIARRKRMRDPKALLTCDLDDDEDEDSLDETLSWGDTLLFPVIGSITLMGLFLIIKYAGTKWINLVLGVYLSGAGMFAIHSTFSTIIAYICRKTGIKLSTYHIRITKDIKQVFHLPLTLPSILLIVPSVALPLVYVPLGRPWILSNLIAECLATTSLAFIRLDSFLTAGVLLAVLLIYDIFWVFATPVMVTVARNLDGPIKLVAPRPSSSSGIDFAMLGLGDVVVPGLMVALCLRYDLARYAEKRTNEDVSPRSAFGKSYFLVALASYLAGLAITIGVMSWTGKAQPALLYLSPACMIGPVLLALIRGEIKHFFAYNDSPESSSAEARDETIEAGSEVAQKARAEARARAENGAASQNGSHEQQEGAASEEQNGAGEEEQTGEPEDDSWMEGGVVTGQSASDGKVRRRKGKKK